MRNPLEFIPVHIRKTLLWANLAFTLLLAVIFLRINAPLVGPLSPAGIISLQLAWSVENTQVILESWDIGIHLIAAFGLGFDYLFMVSYALTISLALLLATEQNKGRFTRLGNWIAWGVIIAALLDALENLGQAQEIVYGTIASWPPVIAVFATLKFILLFLGLSFVLFGLAKHRTG